MPDQNATQVKDSTQQHQAKLDRLLCECIRRGSFKRVKILLAYGANANAKYALSQRPAHIAAYHGYVEILQLLAQNGADLEAVDSHKNAPAQHAAACGHLGVLKFLHEAGIPLNKPNPDGMTTAEQAAFGGYQDILEFLRDSCGVDLTAKGSQNRTLALWAARGGQAHLLPFLKLANVDMDAPDANGETPLHASAFLIRMETMTCLVYEMKVNLDAQNNEGKTTLYLAVDYGNSKAAQLLLNAGANPYLPDHEGNKPIDVTNSINCRILLEPFAAEKKSVTPHLPKTAKQSPITRRLIYALS